MRHDWVFDVLGDVRSYAERHGFVALAAKAEETLQVARVEIAAAEERPPPEPAQRRNAGN